MKVQSKVLKALLTHASTDKARPWLCSVWLEEGSDYAGDYAALVATDGHRMAVLRGQGFWWKSTGKGARRTPFPRALLEGAVAAAGAKGDVELLHGDGKPSVTVTGKLPCTMQAPPVDGELPSWRDVIPASTSEGSKAAEWHANPAYLIDACELVRAVASENRAVFQRPESEISPFVVRDAGKHVTVVIMPMRA